MAYGVHIEPKFIDVNVEMEHCPMELFSQYRYIYENHLNDIRNIHA